MEPVNQPDYLDGKVVHVGTGSESVSVHVVEERTVQKCTATPEMAARLSSCLNGPVIRAFGAATWRRNESGTWELLQFSIEEFVTLEDKTLAEAITQLDEKNRSR